MTKRKTAKQRKMKREADNGFKWLAAYFAAQGQRVRVGNASK